MFNLWHSNHRKRRYSLLESTGETVYGDIYTINTTTGNATSVGTLKGKAELVGFAIPYNPPVFYTVTFTVTDGTNPIENATISIVGQSDLTTNASGVATIQLEDGTYTYSVTATGFQTLNNQQFTVNGADLPVNVTMSPVLPDQYTVTFTVTDGTNPIEGATISIVGQSDLTTNASGVATIQLENGTYTYTVAATGYNPVPNTQFVVDGADLPVNVTMSPVALNNIKQSITLYPNPTNDFV
jgi:hypothetical protein